VDNFNDDGPGCGPKLRSHTTYIHQNRIGALPIGASPWGVGVDGRVPLFGETVRPK